MTKYKTSGVCCSEINFQIEDGIIREVSFEKGCNGNLSGIAALVTNMKIQDVIEKLDGIRCGNRDTSCPDQLAKALKSISK